MFMVALLLAAEVSERPGGRGKRKEGQRKRCPASRSSLSSAWMRPIAVLAPLALSFLLAVSPSPRADDVTYLVHEPPKGTSHPPLIVLLHGSGSDEHDMIRLWHDLPADFVVISPRAPFHDAAGGNRWYRKGPTQDADIAMSRKVVDLIVANAIQRFDADPKRIFIGGFSQGAVMTYEVALHEPGRFRGAAVLSGVLFPTATANVASSQAGQSFFVGHGTSDARIPFAARDISQGSAGTPRRPDGLPRLSGDGPRDGRPGGRRSERLVGRARDQLGQSRPNSPEALAW